ncbi:MAG TPA: hypothetical protein VES60_07670, partial [Nakamurella sp.]|nr:hypothetical protein [Nakamurella sp.]
MTLTGWSNDTIDWNAPLSISPAYQVGIVDRSINPVYDNPIVLLHDGSPGNYRQNTVDSLQRIIDSYRSRGYVFTDPLGRTGNTGDPAGSLDLAVSPAPGQIRVAGWSFDPSAPTEPVGIHTYINGVGYPSQTGGSRPDVKAAYPQTTADQGFDLTWPAFAGINTVCVYAINIGPGSHVILGGCRTIAVADANPARSLDLVSSPAPGQIRVAGWSFDPSAPTEPVGIHVYINGLGYARSTGAYRPDVRTAYPQTTANHGFVITLPAPSGSDTVCVYAINIG